MDSIHIQGGMPLQGKVRIQGSKNAALPILAAAWRDADFTLALGECVLGAAFACVWKK